ncbi:MAG: hypothetical protein IJ806_04295 [Ruminococcus sp.]|nr:hypothetical protein [Ruminococcus sp.]
MSSESLEQIIYDETEKRLAEMSKEDYEFPERADKKDYIGIALAVGVCLLLIILCMTGVIE